MLNGLGSYLHCMPLISYLGTSPLMLSQGMPHDLSGLPSTYNLEMYLPHMLNFWSMRDRCLWTIFFTYFALLDGLSWSQFIWLLGKQSQEIKQSVADEEKTHLIIGSPFLIASLPCPLLLLPRIDTLISLCHRLHFFRGESRLTEWLYGYGEYYGVLSDMSKFLNYSLHRLA